MRHPDADELALAALRAAPAADRGGSPGDAALAAHLAACARCAAELAALRETVVLARETGPQHAGADPGPPPRVWAGIVDELGIDPAAVPGPDDATAPMARVVPLRRGARRRMAALVAAAAVLGALAGVGVAGWWRGGSGADPVARAALGPLDGAPTAAASSAELVETDGARTLRVRAEGLPAPAGYYEVWLIDERSGRLQSLGALDAGGSGAFAVPAGVPLGEFGTVDVSVEPFDGDPAHSRDSVLRGPLQDL